MTKVEITYNPFLVYTDIYINGKPSQGHYIKEYRSTRLQQNLTELFPDLIDECGDDLSVTFRGTQLDFEDIKSAAQDYRNSHPNIKIDIEKPIIAPNAEKRIQALKELFQVLHQECPFEDLRSDDVAKKFNEAMASKFKVSVLATMSSGKSTLINAMLGRELMPAKNEACTATIATIEDDDNLTDFEAVCKDEDGNVICDSKPLTAEMMQEYNDNPQVATIEIKGNIPFVTSQDMQLVLEDTPGPNNSRTEEHKRHTYKVINEESKPMVLYILNATQIGTNDDDYLLKNVAKSMKVGGKQSRDRFIFVANKVDNLDTDYESLPEILQHLREYLIQHGIENPAVYPVSAEYAKVIRMSQGNDRLTKKQKIEVINSAAIFSEDEAMHLEQYAPLSPAGRFSLSQAVKKTQEANDQNSEALIHTGVPGLEFAIREYLDKYALTNKIESAVNTFKAKIEQKNIENDLMESLQGNEEERKKLQKQIQLLQKQIKAGNTESFMRQMDAAVENVNQQIESKGNAIFKDFNNQIVGVTPENEFSLDEVSQIIYQLRNQSQQVEVSLQSELDRMVQDTVGWTAQRLVQAYNDQYHELLAGQEISINMKDTIDVIMSDLPSASTFVQEYQEQKTWEEKVGERYVKNENKKWYKPWTWFQDSGYYEDIYETRHREYIKGSDINEQYVSPIAESIDDNITLAESEAKKEAQNFKKWFLGKLKEIDQIVQERVNELDRATADQQSVQRTITDNKEKLQWLHNFVQKLEKILSV